MKKVYLASPLGFAESTRGFMAETIERLARTVGVVNPWDDTRFAGEIASAKASNDLAERKQLFHEINMGIGAKNEEMIRACEGMVAVLDGVDVDSGTSGEIGFAYALGKTVFGLRTDWRVTGDNEASGVNLQLRYFIEASGGAYFTSLDELEAALAAWVAA
jgi:nucleoside 2-deoxyribosyltransferase